MEEQKMRILVVHSQPLIRLGVVCLLEGERDFEVVGESGGGQHALEKAKESVPDIMLMELSEDASPEDLQPISLIRSVVHHCPDAHVIVFGTNDPNRILEAMEAGARGYLLLKDPATLKDRLFSALRTVRYGECLLDHSIATAVFGRLSGATPDPSRPQEQCLLSERERDVIQLMASGASNKEIADMLCISKGTVKTHVANIFHKLEVRDRTGAVTRAFQKGLIDLCAEPGATRQHS